MKILSYYRFPPKFQSLTVAEFGIPVMFPGWILRADRVRARVRVSGSWAILDQDEFNTAKSSRTYLNEHHSRI